MYDRPDATNDDEPENNFPNDVADTRLDCPAAMRARVGGLADYALAVRTRHHVWRGRGLFRCFAGDDHGEQRVNCNFGVRTTPTGNPVVSGIAGKSRRRNSHGVPTVSESERPSISDQLAQIIRSHVSPETFAVILEDVEALEQEQQLRELTALRPRRAPSASPVAPTAVLDQREE